MMKKILVVLLVLAVATGVFAQEGEWSLGGKVEIGTFIDFDPDPTSGDDYAIYKSSGYWSPYNYYGPTNGQLVATYRRDALSIGLTFNTLDDDRVNGNVEYDGGNYKLQAAANLQNLIASGGKDVGRLWGYYKMMNEIVHLEVAYNSRDTTFWDSDKTGTFAGAGGIGSPVLSTKNGGASYNYAAAPFGGDRESFTKVDHANYLLGDIQLEGISFGIMLRSIFADDYATTKDNTGHWVTNTVANNPDSPNVPSWSFPRAVGTGTGYSLIDEVLMKATFGVKLDMQPVQVAAQFRMGDYGAYFGGKFMAGPVTLGLSFMGLLVDAGGVDGATAMKFGGGVEYNPGAFGATVKGYYAIDKADASNRVTQIGIEPGFYYNVIPTHLRFQTDVAFYFTGGKANGEKVDLETTWGIQPQLFWNFLGTGAADYYGFNTGIILRYRLFSDAYNAFDVSFRFSF
jgi:hypothetical protein